MHIWRFDIFMLFFSAKNDELVIISIKMDLNEADIHDLFWIFSAFKLNLNHQFILFILLFSKLNGKKNLLKLD